MNKKKAVILWILFVACLVTTVYLNRAVMNSDPDYEDVNVIVLSSKTVQYVNRKTGTRTNKYEIEVMYDGERQELINAHDSYSYREGATVKAYLANGKLYANPEGVKTSTPLAKVYFGFLFGTFALFVAACMSLSKKKAKAGAAKKPEPEPVQATPDYDPEIRKK